MIRNKFTLTSSVLLGAVCTSPLSASNEEKPSDKPNIILIMVDQLTASAMSCAGNEYVKTPAMDALAEDGIRFSRSYVTYPLSGPSRSSLFTGQMPIEIGVTDNGGKMNDGVLEKNLGYLISDSGYDCLYAGKWHAPEEVNLPEEGTGFTKICDMDDPTLVDQCVPYLQQKREKPMFLVASFLNPHEICEFVRDEALHYGQLDTIDINECPPLPYNAGITPYFPEAISLHRRWVPRSYPTELYTDDDWRRYLYAYYRLVERVDNEVGKLISELKKNNLYDNSLILFVSDHGEGMGAHRGNQKRVLYEEIVNIPFIVKAPDNKIKGKSNDDALISINLDIFQTICDYSGAEINKEFHGKSIRPLLEGKTETHHEEVYIETLLDGIDTRAWAVVGKDFKYVYYRFYKNKEQLFNLTEDPYEIQNLAVDKNYEDQKLMMRKKLYDWAIKTNDKLLIRTLKNQI